MDAAVMAAIKMSEDGRRNNGEMKMGAIGISETSSRQKWNEQQIEEVKLAAVIRSGMTSK